MGREHSTAGAVVDGDGKMFQMRRTTRLVAPERSLPDNKATVGTLVALIFAEIAGVLFFLSGVIGRAIYGPPPA
jgi:hypothetical protein